MDHQLHSMKVTGFALGYSTPDKEPREEYADPGGPEEHFNLELQVRLDEPIKTSKTVDGDKTVLYVEEGELTVYGHEGSRGGSLNHRNGFLHGCLWIGLHGATALCGLLNSGTFPTLHLWGTKFRNRSCIIQTVSWFTPGHAKLGAEIDP